MGKCKLTVAKCREIPEDNLMQSFEMIQDPEEKVDGPSANQCPNVKTFPQAGGYFNPRSLRQTCLYICVAGCDSLHLCCP